MHISAIPLLALLSAPLIQAAAIPGNGGNSVSGVAAPVPGSCVTGIKATPNALYAINCKSAPWNITEHLSFSIQPSFGACLTACDNNPACQFIDYFQGGWNECLQFADFFETTRFTTPGQYRGGDPNTGAIAICKNGRYTVPGGKTFMQSCAKSLYEPSGYISGAATPSFHGCMALCSSTSGCTAALYSQSQASCALWRESGSIMDPGATSDDMMATLA